jgi:hypothetical protein
VRSLARLTLSDTTHRIYRDGAAGCDPVWGLRRGRACRLRWQQQLVECQHRTAIDIDIRVLEPADASSRPARQHSRSSFSGTDKLAGKVTGKGKAAKTIITGSATITSGSGAFTGATGSFKITGVSPPHIAYLLLKFQGSLTVP